MTTLLSDGLPAPREFLVTLIRSIAAIPVDEPPADETAEQSPSSGDPAAAPLPTAGGNPLERIALPSHRSLLAALHVLFPSLLLPALDLLDRRRVVRWSYNAPGPDDGLRSSSLTGRNLEKRESERGRLALFQIRGGSSAQVVHLRVWHCSCAYFALQVAHSSRVEAEDTATARKCRPAGGFYDLREGDGDDGRDAEWRGGLSSEDAGGGIFSRRLFSSPPCKHLLACLLAETWPALSSAVVEMNECSREAVVGVMAEI